MTSRMNVSASTEKLLPQLWQMHTVERHIEMWGAKMLLRLKVFPSTLILLLFSQFCVWHWDEDKRTPSNPAYMTEPHNDEKNGKKNQTKQTNTQNPHTLQTRSALFCLTALQMTPCWKWSGWGRKLFPWFCLQFWEGKRDWFYLNGKPTCLCSRGRQLCGHCWRMFILLRGSFYPLLTITLKPICMQESSKIKYRSGVI